MPATITFSLTSPYPYVTTTYTLTWGNWVTPQPYFYQYLAAGPVAGDVVRRIDYFCSPGAGPAYRPIFEAVVYFGTYPPNPETIMIFGPANAHCCLPYSGENYFLWAANNGVVTSGATSGATSGVG
jgi:hypothetical protein